MRKSLTISAIALFTLLFTVGCNKSEQRAALESDSYDDVGEVRVFEAPRRSRTNGTSEIKLEDAPAPAPMPAVASISSTKIKTKKPHHHVMVGELDVND